MKKVGVVILNYKVKDLAIRAVKSVLDSTYPELSIIVVDNNSKDGLGEELTKDRSVIFIQNSANLGFTGGNNVGIKKALNMGAELVFMLNPDAYVEKDTIEKLVTGLERYHAGIVNPKIYFDNSKTIWFAGKKFDYKNVLASHIGVDKEDHGQFDEEKELEDATGAALLISKEVLEKVGDFDDRYFLYYEESDLVYRAKKAGFKAYYIPSAVVYHKNAQSTGVGSPLQDYFITRNRMLFASKFLPFRTRFALFREALRHLGNPNRRLALFDFLTGKFGQGSFKMDR